MEQHTSINRLTIENWRQFSAIDLDLTRQLTVLTGENGTGKSTLLSLLGLHFGYSRSFIGTPTRRSNGEFVFLPGRSLGRSEAVEFEGVGTVEYASGATTRVGFWAMSQAEFHLMFEEQQVVPGLVLDSHRVVTNYGRVESVPARFKSATELAQEYRMLLFQSHMSGAAVKNPSLLMKESLVAAALYSEGTSAMRADPLAAEVWAGFQQVLSILLPPGLGFQRLMVDQAEVLVETKTGVFALEAASGGASAIFEVAWQIFLQSRETDSFTVCFDEPENHLHPSMQRSLLPNLLKAFPNVRFIVATHSPFVVTSSRDASVYVLERTTEGVRSSVLDLHDQALSVDEVLRDVLGVGTTLPAWAEAEYEAVMREFMDRDLEVADVARLSDRLRKAGLRFSMPGADVQRLQGLKESGLQ